MRRLSGKNGDETAKPVESSRQLVESARSVYIARSIEFCDIDRVLRDRSSLVTTENSVVGCAAAIGTINIVYYPDTSG